MLGLDPVKLAKAELKKVDLNQDKIPDVYQALDAAEAALNKLADFFADLDAAELVAMLQLLNSLRREDRRRSLEELKALAAQLLLIPSALRQAASFLEQVEHGLK